MVALPIRLKRAVVSSLLIICINFAHHRSLMFSEVCEGNYGKYRLYGLVIRWEKYRKVDFVLCECLVKRMISNCLCLSQ